jgi:signal transduction histidine kinase
MATALAVRIREARGDLTAHWLERIGARVDPDDGRTLAADALADRVTVVLEGIADYLEDPSDEISADLPVVAAAMALGEQRFTQGFDATEILKEYEILGGVLFSFASRVAAEPSPHASDDLLVCAHRIFRALAIVEQVTTAHYLRILGERVGEREERLRRFGRLLTHELKNRVGATLGAGQLLEEEWLPDEERRRFAGMVTENAKQIQKVLENLIALSRVDVQRRRQRNIMLREVVTEVFRQLRELARAREVELRIGGELPGVEVNAAAVELCLSNYVSNAIKYSDPARRQRWAEVEAELQRAADGAAEVVIRVRDNGLGVAAEKRPRMFERFFRAHEHLTRVEGTGLGLSLVQETAESLGGRAWAELEQESGAVFAFSLPCRRSEDGELSCVGSGSGVAAPNPAGGGPGTASG